MPTEPPAASAPIGIFDSGFGGLGAARHIRRLLPSHDLLFLGDSARAPYGGRSAAAVERYTRQGVDYLFARGCPLVLLACITASADALRAIQQDLPPNKKVLGALVPAAQAALRQTRFGRIGIVATRATVASGALQREIAARAATEYRAPTRERRALPAPVATANPAPLLVPLVEEGLIKHPITSRLVRGYLRPLKNAHIDTLILGCTHFPLLQTTIARKAGRRVCLVDPAAEQASALKTYLGNHPEIDSRLTKNSQQKFLTTDDPQHFAALGRRFWGEDIRVNRVDVVGEGVGG